MPSASVRAAVVNYFTGTPGIASMSKDEPWFTPAGEWYSNGVQGTACYVHIDHQNESFVTVGQQLGQKSITYDIAIVVAYQYTIKPSDTNADVWVDGLDTLLDTICHKLRIDPTLGCGGAGPIWQAGIEDMDITIQRALPVRDSSGGKIWSINYVMFKAIEIVGALQ